LRPEDNPTGRESEKSALERSLSGSVCFKVSQEKVSCTPSQQYVLTPASTPSPSQRQSRASSVPSSSAAACDHPEKKRSTQGTDDISKKVRESDYVTKNLESFSHHFEDVSPPDNSTLRESSTGLRRSGRIASQVSSVEHIKILQQTIDEQATEFRIKEFALTKQLNKFRNLQIELAAAKTAARQHTADRQQLIDDLADAQLEATHATNDLQTVQTAISSGTDRFTSCPS